MQILKIKKFCESDDNHNEHQKDEHEHVKEDIRIILIKCGIGRYENVHLFSFPRMCLSLYDYQSKASRYRWG